MFLFIRGIFLREGEERVWMEGTPRKFFPGKRSAVARTGSPGAGAEQNAKAKRGEWKQPCKCNSWQPGDRVAPRGVKAGTSSGFFGQRNVTLAITIISKRGKKKKKPTVDNKKEWCEATEELRRAPHWPGPRRPIAKPHLRGHRQDTLDLS